MCTFLLKCKETLILHHCTTESLAMFSVHLLCNMQVIRRSSIIKQTSILAYERNLHVFAFRLLFHAHWASTCCGQCHLRVLALRLLLHAHRARHGSQLSVAR